jgi:hypothetical protein
MGNFNKLPFFNWFAKRRRTRGTMWASLLGLGISAAVFGLTRGKRKYTALPFQNMMKNFTVRNPGVMGNAALTEFSQELLASALKNDRKDDRKE